MVSQNGSEHDLGAEPIEPKYHRDMEAIASSLNKLFNGEAAGETRQTGFVLLVFPFNDATGRCNYISNGAARTDVIRLFEEQITRFRAEGFGDDDTPMIGAMANAIDRTLALSRSGHIISREALESAAQAAMLVYRKGV